MLVLWCLDLDNGIWHAFYLTAGMGRCHKRKNSGYQFQAHENNGDGNNAEYG